MRWLSGCRDFGCSPIWNDPTVPMHRSVADTGPRGQNPPVEETPGPLYLLGIQLIAERVPDFEQYPFSVPCIRSLDLSFTSRVTFLVGENGSGKSTLLEGIASVCRLPLSGGGRQDLASRHGPRDETSLAGALRPRFRQQPRDAYFFRGEFSAPSHPCSISVEPTQIFGFS